MSILWDVIFFLKRLWRKITKAGGYQVSDPQAEDTQDVWRQLNSRQRARATRKLVMGFHNARRPKAGTKAHRKWANRGRTYRRLLAKGLV